MFVLVVVQEIPIVENVCSCPCPHVMSGGVRTGDIYDCVTILILSSHQHLHPLRHQTSSHYTDHWPVPPHAIFTSSGVVLASENILRLFLEIKCELLIEASSLESILIWQSNGCQIKDNSYHAYGTLKEFCLSLYRMDSLSIKNVLGLLLL